MGLMDLAHDVEQVTSIDKAFFVWWLNTIVSLGEPLIKGTRMHLLKFHALESMPNSRVLGSGSSQRNSCGASSAMSSDLDCLMDDVVALQRPRWTAQQLAQLQLL